MELILQQQLNKTNATNAHLCYAIMRGTIRFALSMEFHYKMAWAKPACYMRGAIQLYSMHTSTIEKRNLRE